MEYILRKINTARDSERGALDALLRAEGITRDANLDYTAGLFDSDGNLAATGSCYTNTLRCLAVKNERRGEGLLERIVSHLIEYQASRGFSHLFLCTKRETAQFFAQLGFYEIALVNAELSFMENRKAGFDSYLARLAEHKTGGKSAALVMNCNPFTLGHLFLAERAARECDTLHIFIVSENASLVPSGDREALVRAGCAHIGNAIFHRTGSYMISRAVFPSYFLQDENAVIRSHAALDAALFTRIARALGVTVRYVGDEPFSRVTGIYNGILRETLACAGINLVVVPRVCAGGDIISASAVRRLIQCGQLEQIKKYVPQSTYDYFLTEKGAQTARKIMQTDDVTHY